MFRLRRRKEYEDPAEREKQLRIDFGLTFGSEHGKRVLSWILEQGHVFHTSYLPQHGPEAAIFREGERNMGLMILDMLQVKDVEKLQEYTED